MQRTSSQVWLALVVGTALGVWLKPSAPQPAAYLALPVRDRQVAVAAARLALIADPNWETYYEYANQLTELRVKERVMTTNAGEQLTPEVYQHPIEEQVQLLDRLTELHPTAEQKERLEGLRLRMFDH